MSVIQRHFTKMISILCVLLLFFLLNKVFLEVNPGYIQRWLLSWGWRAPIIFLAMFTVRPFTLFPSSLLAITAGLAFGVWEGFLYTMIGSFSGAVLSFWAVRKLGKSLVKKEWTGGYSKKLQNQLEHRGFFYVLLFRLIPFLTFDLITYMAAVSKVRFRDYFFGTLFGIVPGAFAYTFLGSSVASGEYQMVMLAFVVLLVVVAVPLLLRNKIKD
ncbi:MAG TPA: TVP38/TMEM64 family protein [Bacillales bacterium]|nr:TVP38/TMEM64 family protein [Bacillales bacterium]